MTNYKLVASVFFALLCTAGFAAPVKAGDYRLTMITDGLDMPWGLAFLPDGDMLGTELSGALRLIRNGEVQKASIEGVPESLYAGQGGLMDIVLHPDFAENRYVYLSLAAGSSRDNKLRVVRGRFTGTALEDVRTIFETAPAKDIPVHYGARMAFMADKTLLITTGDGFDYREEAQNLGNHFGVTARVTDNGKVPTDNPFANDNAAQPEIWSYGHRNPQSIVYDAQTGKVYQTEHGPRGGDELNLIEPGKNYGWPIATYGIDYSGARISPYTEYEGTVQPLKYWTPSIGPSGMELYRGAAFPAWQGDIFVTSLIFNYTVRLDMANGAPVGEEILFTEIGERLRDIRQGPDGALYILSEGGDSGKLWRVDPTSRDEMR